MVVSIQGLFPALAAGTSCHVMCIMCKKCCHVFASHSILNTTLFGHFTVTPCMEWQLFCFQGRAIDVKAYTASVAVSTCDSQTSDIM